MYEAIQHYNVYKQEQKLKNNSNKLVTDYDKISFDTFLVNFNPSFISSKVGTMSVFFNFRDIINIFCINNIIASYSATVSVNFFYFI